MTKPTARFALPLCVSLSLVACGIDSETAAVVTSRDGAGGASTGGRGGSFVGENGGSTGVAGKGAGAGAGGASTTQGGAAGTSGAASGSSLEGNGGGGSTTPPGGTGGSSAGTGGTGGSAGTGGTGGSAGMVSGTGGATAQSGAGGTTSAGTGGTGLGGQGQSGATSTAAGSGGAGGGGGDPTMGGQGGVVGGAGTGSTTGGAGGTLPQGGAAGALGTGGFVNSGGFGTGGRGGAGAGGGTSVGKCGNGKVEKEEECDPLPLPGNDGALLCSPDCKLCPGVLRFNQCYFPAPGKKVPWDQAADACGKAGARLASPNFTELDALAALEGKEDIYWAAVRQLDAAASAKVDWKWTAGPSQDLDVPPQIWSANEPNDLGQPDETAEGEDCGAVIRSRAFRYDDKRCGDSFATLCQRTWHLAATPPRTCASALSSLRGRERAWTRSKPPTPRSRSSVTTMRARSRPPGRHKRCATRRPPCWERKAP